MHAPKKFKHRPKASLLFFFSFFGGPWGSAFRMGLSGPFIFATDKGGAM
jgi:hypothetical protein